MALLVATACQRPATCMLSGVWVAPSCPQQHQQASDRCLASREGTTLHTCMLLGGLQTGRVCVCVCNTLPLPGWIGGIVTLLVFYAITLWASLLLTECHETGGMKHPTYRSAVLHILGE